MHSPAVMPRTVANSRKYSLLKLVQFTITKDGVELPFIFRWSPLHVKRDFNFGREVWQKYLYVFRFITQTRLDFTHARTWKLPAYPLHQGTSALGYRPYPGEVLGTLPAADAMSNPLNHSTGIKLLLTLCTTVEGSGIEWYLKCSNCTLRCNSYNRLMLGVGGDVCSSLVS